MTETRKKNLDKLLGKLDENPKEQPDTADNDEDSYQSTVVTPIDETESPQQVRKKASQTTHPDYKEGDIIFFRASANSITDGFINFAQKLRRDCTDNADIVHAAIVTKATGTNVEIAHFTKDGFKTEPLHTSHYQSHGHEIYRPASGGELLGAVKGYADKHENPSSPENKTKYSIPKMIASFLKVGKIPGNISKPTEEALRIRSNTEEICSSFVCRCLKTAGISVPGNSTYVLPGALKAALTTTLQNQFTRVSTNDEKIDALMEKVKQLKTSAESTHGNPSKIQARIEIYNKILAIDTTEMKAKELFDKMMEIVIDNKKDPIGMRADRQALLDEGHKLGINLDNTPKPTWHTPQIKAKPMDEEPHQSPRFNH